MNKKMADFLSTKRSKAHKVHKIRHNNENEMYTTENSDDTNILKIKDGKIIVDETELYIRKSHLKGPVIEIDDNIPVTSATYAIRKCGKRWNSKDTAIFYDALKHWGMDFSVISNVLKNRTRKEIKNKFNVECRRNKEKVDNILKNWKGFDWEKWEALDKNDN